MIDKHGRPIHAGDLLKIYHFTARRRRRVVFMYKLVVRVDCDLKIHPQGEYLYAVDVVDIACKGSLEKAHKCPLSVIGPPEDVEIIDNAMGVDGKLFWEREKVAPSSVKARGE